MPLVQAHGRELLRSVSAVVQGDGDALNAGVIRGQAQGFQPRIGRAQVDDSAGVGDVPVGDLEDVSAGPQQVPRPGQLRRHDSPVVADAVIVDPHIRRLSIEQSSSLAGGVGKRAVTHYSQRVGFDTRMCNASETYSTACRKGPERSGKVRKGPELTGEANW